VVRNAPQAQGWTLRSSRLLDATAFEGEGVTCVFRTPWQRGSVWQPAARHLNHQFLLNFLCGYWQSMARSSPVRAQGCRCDGRQHRRTPFHCQGRPGLPGSGPLLNPAGGQATDASRQLLPCRADSHFPFRRAADIWSRGRSANLNHVPGTPAGSGSAGQSGLCLPSGRLSPKIPRAQSRSSRQRGPRSTRTPG